MACEYATECIDGQAVGTHGRELGHIGGTYLAACNYTPDRARAAVAEGRAELVAFGRPYVANPDLVTRMQLGIPLAQGDSATYYGGSHPGYTDYPLATRVG